MPAVRRPLMYDYALAPDGQRYEVLAVEEREHDDYYTVHIAATARGYLRVRVGVTYSEAAGAWLPYERGWFADRVIHDPVAQILGHPEELITPRLAPPAPPGELSTWYVARRMLFVALVSLAFMVVLRGC